MSDRDSKVIGLFALRPPVDVVCADVDACLIVDSEQVMKAYVEQVFSLNAGRVTIKKTRFGEIYRGLMLGAAYAFDEPSYSRFYPLALDAGLPVSPADFKKAQDDGQKFFTVRLAVK